MFRKKKNSRGHAVEDQWVFGGTEREEVNLMVLIETRIPKL